MPRRKTRESYRNTLMTSSNMTTVILAIYQPWKRHFKCLKRARLSIIQPGREVHYSNISIILDLFKFVIPITILNQISILICLVFNYYYYIYITLLLNPDAAILFMTDGEATDSSEDIIEYLVNKTSQEVVLLTFGLGKGMFIYVLKYFCPYLC